MLTIILYGLTLSLDESLNAVLNALQENDIVIPGLNTIDGLKAYLSLSQEEFAENAALGAVGRPTIESERIDFEMSNICFYFPYKNKETIAYEAKFLNLNAAAADVHQILIRALIEGFVECGENYVFEAGGAPWFSLIAEDADKMLDITETVKTVVLGNFKIFSDLIGREPWSLTTDMYYSRETVQAWIKGEKEFGLSDRIAIAEKYGVIKTGIVSKK